MDTNQEQATTDRLPALLRDIQALDITADYAIKSAIEADFAANSLRHVNGLLKRVDLVRSSDLAGPLKVVADIRDKYREPEGLLEKAKASLRRAIGAWTDKVLEADRLARIAQETRLATERAQVAAEEAAKAGKAREAAEQARTLADVALAAGAKATAAKWSEKAAGLDERAQIIDAGAQDAINAVDLAAPQIEAAQKFDGVSSSVSYVAEVRDLRAFMTACVADPHLDLDSLFAVKPAGLRALAKAYKMGLALKYPGSVAKPERTVSARAK